jgi:hypothetical protein
METAGMLLVTVTPSGTETGSAVNVAWDTLIYLYSPQLHLAVVSLGLVYNVRWKNGGCWWRRPTPGEAARTRYRG